jgi:hypothetical protein
MERQQYVTGFMRILRSVTYCSELTDYTEPAGVNLLTDIRNADSTKLPGGSRLWFWPSAAWKNRSISPLS